MISPDKIVSFSCFLLAFSLNVLGQDRLTISLSEEHIYPGPLNFRVIKIVDGREIKSTIGIVRKGINNLLASADFEKPAEEEFMDLINRSYAMSKKPPYLALRIHNLKISEGTRTRDKYSTAELTMDVFFVLEDSLYFIGRRYAAQKSEENEMILRHPFNIASVVEKILKDVNNYDLENHVVKEAAIVWNALPDFRPTQSKLELPILTDSIHSDGVYTNFDHFKNNKPNITDGYIIEADTKISLRWLDEEGKKTRQKESVYAIAFNNTLYKYFNGKFYPIQKRGDTLIFFGAEIANAGQVAKNWLWGGLVVAALSSTGNKARIVYEINLTSGDVTEQGFSK